jgi:hypothetical protein
MSLVIAQHTSLKILQIDPNDAKFSLEDMTRQHDKCFRTANSFHVKGDNKYTKSVWCIVFMITGGRIPLIREMTEDEYRLRSMEHIDPADLRMSYMIWEKRGLVPMGKMIEHASMYGTDLSDDENAESVHLRIRPTTMTRQ